jgi:hypothetical protein
MRNGVMGFPRNSAFGDPGGAFGHEFGANSNAVLQAVEVRDVRKPDLYIWLLSRTSEFRPDAMADRLGSASHVPPLGGQKAVLEARPGIEPGYTALHTVA